MRSSTAVKALAVAGFAAAMMEGTMIPHQLERTVRTTSTTKTVLNKRQLKARKKAKAAKKSRQKNRS